jgi:hypothetical protein
MSNWTFNHVRIYVVKDVADFQQEIARLQPLRAGTIHHVFGWDDPVVKLEAVVVGSPTALNLISFTKSGSSMELMSPYGDLGDYYLKSINFDTIPTIKQTIDRTQDCDATVYRVNMELYKDE